jgi:hypothetical protein
MMMNEHQLQERGTHERSTLLVHLTAHTHTHTHTQHTNACAHTYLQHQLVCGHQDDRSRVGLVARQAITRAVHEAAYEGEEVGCRLAGARGCGGQHISACVWK